MSSDEDQEAAMSRAIRSALPRQVAPDVLKARIRASLEQAAASPPPVRTRPGWIRLAAAGVLIAVTSSALTYAALSRRTTDSGDTNAVVETHVRSLMANHIADVASTNQHNVKPWFNGRVDIAPPVPNLDLAGFRLIGGRVDTVMTHRSAATIYGRRQHLIAVYAWAEADRSARSPARTSDRGFHVVSWAADGIELRAVSDLNWAELDEFVRLFRASQ
jgi:anti-sigma factor RsiW